MRPFLLFSAVALAGHATVASAQYTAPAKKGGIKLSDVAGTWDVKSMMGPKDSVVVTSVVTATADRKGWTIKLANRDPIPVRVVAVGGDSVVMDAGPYESILRPGQMVTTHQRSEEHTSELQSRLHLVCRLLLEKKKKKCNLH